MRISILGFGVVLLSLPFVLRANDNDDGADAITDRVASTSRPVSLAHFQKFTAIAADFTGAEQRGYFDYAKQRVLEMLALSRQDFPDSHFMVRQARSCLIWHEWIEKLTPDERSIYWKTIPALESDGDTLVNERKFSEAAEKYGQALTKLEGLKEPAFQDMALLKVKVSRAHVWENKSEEAVTLAESAYNVACKYNGKDSPLAAEALLAVGMARHSLGQYDKSLRALSTALRTWNAYIEDISATEDGSKLYAEALVWGIDSLFCIKDISRAGCFIDELETTLARQASAKETSVYQAKRNRCRYLELTNHPAEAHAKAEELLDYANRTFATDSDEQIDSRITYARTSFGIGKIESANALCTALIKEISRDQRFQDRLVDLAKVHATLLIARHENEHAARFLKSVFRGMSDETDPLLADLFELYTSALYQLGREDEAKSAGARVEAAKKAMEEMRRKVDADPDCQLPWRK